jgi:PTS system nitrogen regulatory IIA component
MHISHLVTPARVAANLEGSTPEAVLAVLAGLLAQDLRQVSAQEILDIFMERERIGPTAIGQGIAIPHGRLAGLPAPVAALGRSGPGVDFNALDGEPVHLIMALLSPPGENAVHLQAISLLSHLLRSEPLRNRLRHISEPSILFHALLEESH